MEELCETRYMSLLNRDTVQQSTTSTVAQESTANLGRGPEILESSAKKVEASTPEQRSEQKWSKAGIIPILKKCNGCVLLPGKDKKILCHS